MFCCFGLQVCVPRTMECIYAWAWQKHRGLMLHQAPVPAKSCELLATTKLLERVFDRTAVRKEGQDAPQRKVESSR